MVIKDIKQNEINPSLGEIFSHLWMASGPEPLRFTYEGGEDGAFAWVHPREVQAASEKLDVLTIIADKLEFGNYQMKETVANRAAVFYNPRTKTGYIRY